MVNSTKCFDANFEFLQDISDIKKEPLTVHHCGFQKCPPSHSFGPAIRDHYLMHFVLSGKGIFHIGEKSYKITKGQGFLILPGTVTTYTADNEEPWHYVWVGYSGSFAKDILSSCRIDLENPVFTFSSVEMASKCILDMFQNICESSIKNKFFILSKLYELFSYITYQKPVQNNPFSAVDCAIDFVAKNYSYGITVSDISLNIGIERSYLYRLFKMKLGYSPQQYLLRFKLEKAAVLLRNTNYTVTEVLLSCGFSDLPNFSRQFKKEFKTTPSQMRNSNNK